MTPASAGSVVPARRTALALATLLVLTALAPVASAAIDRPRLSPGDSWTYATRLEENLGLRFEGNTTLEAGDVVTVVVQGRAVDAMELLLSGGGTVRGGYEGVGTVAGTWSLEGTEHWETGAWKSVRSFLRLTAEGRLEGDAAPVRLTLTVVNETTRRILNDDWSWPIEAGATGSTTARWDASQTVTVRLGGLPANAEVVSFDGVVTTTYAYERTQTITVPAGTFDAYVIREERWDGSYRLRWLSARTGADVRQEEYNDTGSLVSTADLTQFRYRAGESLPFPWPLVLVASLAGVAVVLLLVLALRRRKPVEVWMPPAPAAPGPPPEERKPLP